MSLPTSCTIGGVEVALRRPPVMRMLAWFRAFTEAARSGDEDAQGLATFAALGLCVPELDGVPAPELGPATVARFAVDGAVLDAWNAADTVAAALLDVMRFSKAPGGPRSSGASPSDTATSAPPSPGGP